MKCSRLIGFLLLTAFTLPFFGTWQFLVNRLGVVKKEMHHRVKSNDVVPDILLKFTPEDSAQLTWEHSREFLYKGIMYDVICSEKFNDTIWFWCHKDMKESKLKSQINNLFANGVQPSPLNNDHSKQLTHFFKTLFFISTTSINKLFCSPQKSLVVYTNLPYINPDNSPLYPPPKEV